MLELMTLFQQMAYVFQLAMAWQSDELDLRVVSSIRCTDALVLNFSLLTLVESWKMFTFVKRYFILSNDVHENISQF